MKLYISACDKRHMGDRAAIQAAIDEAHSTDIRTVRIPQKDGGWKLDAPVMLPDDVTVILDGATLCADREAFINVRSNEPYALATEQFGITLLGINGATIIGTDAPHIRLGNIRQFRISGIRMEKGTGIRLLHARKGRLDGLEFYNCRHGVWLGEGCRENILRDIIAETLDVTVLFTGGNTSVWGRSSEICQSSLYRMRVKTGGKPAVAIRQGHVPVSNLLLRDIIDTTVSDDYAVLLGDGDAEIRDVSVRNMTALRPVAMISDACDGIFLKGLSGKTTVVSESATRILQQSATETPEQPVLQKSPWTHIVTANDPEFFGNSDAETLQNAVDAAQSKDALLVIPRYNARTGSMRWDLDRTVTLRGNSHIVLLDAHLRLCDFTYCNLFAAAACGNISVVGIGTAQLDSGIPNGLKVKNAGKLGFGPITDNALLQFVNIKGLRIRGIHVHQSRWYGIYCKDCENAQISDVDYYAPPIFPDLGGIFLNGNCRDFLIENLTGITGENMVQLEAAASTVQNIHIRSINANVSRCCVVDMNCHNGGSLSDIVAEGLIDSSLPEQKKQPYAMVQIGHRPCSERPAGRIENVSVRDVYGRSAATVEFSGYACNTRVENIHSFSNTVFGIRTSPVAEAVEYLVGDTTAKLASLSDDTLTGQKGFRLNGLFFRCQQASPYMRGTATSIITDKKKFVGTVAELTGLETEDLLMENILAERVGKGIHLTGKATVNIRNLEIAQCGREETLCGTGCILTVEGAPVPVTDTIPL